LSSIEGVFIDLIPLDTYSHVAPGLQVAAANRFDDVLLPRQINDSINNSLVVNH